MFGLFPIPRPDHSLPAVKNFHLVTISNQSHVHLMGHQKWVRPSQYATGPKPQNTQGLFKGKIPGIPWPASSVEVSSCHSMVKTTFLGAAHPFALEPHLTALSMRHQYKISCKTSNWRSSESNILTFEGKASVLDPYFRKHLETSTNLKGMFEITLQSCK